MRVAGRFTVESLSPHRVLPVDQDDEFVDGLNADIDATGEVVGLDIDNASHRLDLTTLEAVALPLRATRVA